MSNNPEMSNIPSHDQGYKGLHLSLKRDLSKRSSEASDMIGSLAFSSSELAKKKPFMLN